MISLKDVRCVGIFFLRVMCIAEMVLSKNFWKRSEKFVGEQKVQEE